MVCLRCQSNLERSVRVSLVTLVQSQEARRRIKNSSLAYNLTFTLSISYVFNAFKHKNCQHSSILPFTVFDGKVREIYVFSMFSDFTVDLTKLR